MRGDESVTARDVVQWVETEWGGIISCIMPLGDSLAIDTR